MLIVLEIVVSSNGSGGNGNGNSDWECIFGWFSVGGEIYYGMLNKFGGMSIGMCFVMLLMYCGIFLVVMLIFNLLMGNIVVSYVVVVGCYCSFVM